MFKSQVGEKEVRGRKKKKKKKKKSESRERFLRKLVGGGGEWKDEGKRQRQERRWMVVL